MRASLFATAATTTLYGRRPSSPPIQAQRPPSRPLATATGALAADHAARTGLMPQPARRSDVVGPLQRHIKAAARLPNPPCRADLLAPPSFSPGTPAPAPATTRPAPRPSSGHRGAHSRAGSDLRHRTRMPRAKPFALTGTAELNATIERVAPDVLGLLADGVPRPKAAIVEALAGRHDKQDVTLALIRLAVTGWVQETGGRYALAGAD